MWARDVYEFAQFARESEKFEAAVGLICDC